MRILTIGGYGFDEHSFFNALERAGVDTFVDTRQRRGLRGARYAFLNSARLQKALRERGVRYVHLRELAPTQAIRDLQREDDSSTGLGKRDRSRLSSRFVEAYKKQVLEPFEVGSFHAAVGSEAQVVALFCVERLPEACHRSLVAEHLGQELSTSVGHITP